MQPSAFHNLVIRHRVVALTTIDCEQAMELGVVDDIDRVEMDDESMAVCGTPKPGTHESHLWLSMLGP